MSIIRKNDHDTIIRAAAAQGRANGRQAALARAILDIDKALGGDAPPQLSVGDGDAKAKLDELAERMSKLEEAMAKAEVPDLTALEKEFGELKARLSSLEEELGTGDSKSAKSSKTSSRKS